MSFRNPPPLPAYGSNVKQNVVNDHPHMLALSGNGVAPPKKKEIMNKTFPPPNTKPIHDLSDRTTLVSPSLSRRNEAPFPKIQTGAMSNEDVLQEMHTMRDRIKPHTKKQRSTYNPTLPGYIVRPRPMDNTDMNTGRSGSDAKTMPVPSGDYSRARHKPEPIAREGVLVKNFATENPRTGARSYDGTSFRDPKIARDVDRTIPLTRKQVRNLTFNPTTKYIPKHADGGVNREKLGVVTNMSAPIKTQSELGDITRTANRTAMGRSPVPYTPRDTRTTGGHNIGTKRAIENRTPGGNIHRNNARLDRMIVAENSEQLAPANTPSGRRMSPMPRFANVQVKDVPEGAYMPYGVQPNNGFPLPKTTNDP